jgi:hypothetical protein
MDRAEKCPEEFKTKIGFWVKITTRLSEHKEKKKISLCPINIKVSNHC